METSSMIMILCSYNYNWLLNMLDNDNIMTEKASEEAQNVPTDEKMIRNTPCAL